MEEIEGVLQEYVATANNPKYKGDYSIINSKFPELKEYDSKVLQEYVVTANNKKYKGDYSIINSKFPEFFEVKKKDNSQPVGAKPQEVSTTQPPTKKSLLAGESQKKPLVSDISSGVTKMKTFTGFTPEEQKSLQAKPVADYMVNKTKEQLNPVVKRQRILESKKVLTPIEKQELEGIKTAKVEGERLLANRFIKDVTPRINEALNVSDDHAKRIEAEYNQDASGGGFWQKTKEVAGSATTAVFQALGSLADLAPSEIKDLEVKVDSPLKKYNDEVINEVKESKEVLTTEQFQQKVKEKYIKDKKDQVRQSQLNEINDNLTDEQKNVLKFNAFDNLTNLTKENKDILKSTKVLEASRDVVHDDFVETEKRILELAKNKQPIPDDLKLQYENVVKKYNDYSSQIKDNYDKYSKNSKDLGTFKQEYEVFNTFGSGILNFGAKVLNSGESILAAGLDFESYMLNVGSNLPGLEQANKIGSLAFQIGSKKLRDDVEYRSQFLRKTTGAVSMADYADKTVGFVADNLIPTVALFLGGEVAIAGMAATTTGDKYNEMVRQKEAGVMTGKDQYSSLQMAVVPALWGATMVAPMATQLGAMRNAQRAMMAIESEAPALIEKTFMDKAIAFGTKYNVESIKLAKDLTVMKGLQQLTDNIILGKDIDYNQFKAGDMLKEAYGLHALNMSMPLVFGVVTKPFFTNKEVKEMTENSNGIFSFSEKLKDENLTQEEREVIQSSINTLTEKSNAIVSSKIQNISKLPSFIADKIYGGFAKSSELRAKALRIKNSENLTTREKKVALEELKNEYKKNETDLIHLRTGNIVGTLPQEEQSKLKEIASDELIKENEGKDFKFSDEDITKRANENFIRDNAKEVEAKQAEAEVKPIEEVKQTETEVKPRGVEDEVSQPIELEVTPKSEEVKPTDEVVESKIESPIELKEGEEFISTAEDSKGRTYTYVAETTEKDGVKTTKFKFNRSDKSSEQRNNAGVETEKVLDKYGYEIPEGEITEGSEITQIYEIREGESSTGATVLFKNIETGETYTGEIVLTPRSEAKPKAEVKPIEVKAPEVEVKAETKTSRRRTKKETLEVTPKAETEKEIVSLPENEKELDKFLLDMQEKGIIKVEPC